MMATPNDPTSSNREGLLSAKQAGWALTLVTIVSLIVGVVVVERLGSDSAPPLEIEAAEQPAVAPGPAFQILEQDRPGVGRFEPTNDGDPHWAEALFSEPGPTSQAKKPGVETLR